MSYRKDDASPATGKGKNPRGGAAREERPLIPARLSFLFKERPLLWYEDPHEYDALRGEMVAYLSPRDILEWILAKDFIDYIWEVRQLRRLKTAATHAELPDAAEETMDSIWETARNMGKKKTAHELALGAAAGVEFEWGGDLATRCEEKMLTAEVLHLQTYKRAFPALTAINRDLDRTERRRDQILAQFEQRRVTFAAMAKSLLAREDAEVIEFVEGS